MVCIGTIASNNSLFFIRPAHRVDNDGCKDLNQMAAEVGWEAARKRLFALLEKAGFEYEYGGKQKS